MRCFKGSDGATAGNDPLRRTLRLRGLRRLVWPLVLCFPWVIGGILGCADGFKFSTPNIKLPGLLGDDEDSGDQARLVALGEWERDYLHCAEGRCNNFYWIDVAQRGDLRVEVYAPWGTGVPDFGSSLLDPNGRPLAAPAKPDARPQRLQANVAPGRYVVRVHAMDSDDAKLSYELIANFTKRGRAGKSAPPKRTGGSSATPQQAPSAATNSAGSAPVAPTVGVADEAPEVLALPDARPPIPVPPGSVLITAEVLDKEEDADGSTYVLLDAGEPESVRVGMRGLLRDSGSAIGQVEVVEVYSDGSRARLIGQLVDEITIDTLAELFDQP